MRLPAGLRFAVAASLVLTLAAFNLCFRLGSEPVAQWDESLYATSALEMIGSGDWIGTTFNGQLDYYNSKPPLNVWLLAAAFKLGGINLIALRAASVAAAWLTVLVLMLWARRFAGEAVAVMSGLVLATSFGFLHIHSGRSGNPDAMMSLLLLLVVVVSSTSERHPWRIAWLGPLLCGVFMLKGLAVLLPLAYLAAVAVVRKRKGKSLAWPPALAAAGLLVLPAAAWALARWQVDGWQFLQLLLTQDLYLAATQPLDGHAGSLLYYANVLQRYQYDWLLAAFVATVLAWRNVRAGVASLAGVVRTGEGPVFALVVWSAVTLTVITTMQTKLSWYANPVYPAFALGVAWLLGKGLSIDCGPRRAVAAVAIVSLLVAQGKLMWHPLQKHRLEGTVQGLIMAVQNDVSGRSVYRNAWPLDDAFVVRGIGGAFPALATDVTSFLEVGAEGDLLVADADLWHPNLERLLASGRYGIFRRR
ncbi:MAG TPA: glycosyltransferase family 39 protein [Vicinamibacterales bacterium]|nr:glycosyltransferase family 39 protein [Vicinamibacterales bacterium]